MKISKGFLAGLCTVPIIAIFACVPSTTYQSTPINATFIKTLGIIPPSPSSTSMIVLATPTLTMSPSAPITPDLVISAPQYGRLVTLSVGQVIALLPPSALAEWQVTYSATLLAVLTPSDRMRAPGPQGWLFRAIAPGQSEIVLTMILTPCPPSSPCPPNVARFVVSIAINR